jgi:hypothetical protein
VHMLRDIPSHRQIIDDVAVRYTKRIFATPGAVYAIVALLSLHTHTFVFGSLDMKYCMRISESCV